MPCKGAEMIINPFLDRGALMIVYLYQRQQSVKNYLEKTQDYASPVWTHGVINLIHNTLIYQIYNTWCYKFDILKYYELLPKYTVSMEVDATLQQ